MSSIIPADMADIMLAKVRPRLANGSAQRVTVNDVYLAAVAGALRTLALRRGQLAEPLRIDGAEFLAVRVWESEDAFGGMRARL